MARRKRYKELETLLTRVLIADAAVFALYLLFAGLGVIAMKVITAIIAIIASGLCLAFLYMCGELKKRRSRWLVLGYACIIVCLMVSLILKYPSPAPELPKASTSATEADGATDAPEATDASEASGTAA